MLLPRPLALLFLLPLLAACAGGMAPPPAIGDTDPAAGTASAIDTSRSKPEVARYVRLGQEAEQGDKPEVAAMMYRAAYQADPADAAPKLAMARMLEGTGDVAQAAQIYDALAKDKALPEDTRATLGYAAARNVMKSQDYAHAAKRYEQLAVDDAGPGRWRAYNGLGVARNLLGDEAAARDAYEHAMQLVPPESAAQVRGNLALSQIIGGDYQAAIRLLEPVADSGMASGEEKRLLALAYGFAGRVPEAQSLGLDEPPSPDMLRQLKITPNAPGVSAAPATAVERAAPLD